MVLTKMSFYRSVRRYVDGVSEPLIVLTTFYFIVMVTALFKA
ncbi:hypothetical protein FQV37_830 [Psychrobacter nivimaris]|uniref:Uncharacterized protein n=1 Tax=Psychrobacter nivimaris TaxID=281738 RepID=A0A6N7BZC5_9GAMM|nr:hypothetical protein FQV37_830 [Psychrobacter nivimaris]